MALTPEINRQVVTGAIRAINRYYVSADVAKALDADLRGRLERGEYDGITSAFTLMDALDKHMQDLSRDRHLALAYSAEATPLAPRDFEPESPQQFEEEKEEARARNYGFERVSRLDGNVGYIELNGFIRPEFSGRTAGDAMQFVSGTDALIIDLRNNRGGSPEMVQFLASYFFADKPVYLGEFFTRVEGRNQQVWSLPFVPSSRYLGKEVFLLTSRRSYSAAEGFANLMQHHKRAAIIGEATRGGTHPGRNVRVHPHFAVFVPMSWFIYPTGEPSYPIGRAIHPESITDRYGTSVKPDIPVSADQALARAHLEALRRISAKDPATRQRLAALVERMEKEQPSSR